MFSSIKFFLFVFLLFNYFAIMHFVVVAPFSASSGVVSFNSSSTVQPLLASRLFFVFVFFLLSFKRDSLK